MMSGEISLLLAFGAGLLSFLSPCVLPLIPSYLSFIGGVSFQELSRGEGDRGRIITRTAFFVLGFSTVFVILGIVFSGPALLFSSALTWINLAAGFIVIILGLNVIFDVFALLNRERRVHVTSRPTGITGAFTVGLAFGAGWTPCIGPILASILFLAGGEGHLLRAALLLLAYSIGLGAPFIAAGIAFSRVTGYVNRIKPYLPAIRTGSGVFLVLLGLLIAFGRFQQLNSVFLNAGFQLQQWSSTNGEAARLLFAGITFVLAVVHPLARAFRKQHLWKPLGSTISLALAVVGTLQLAGILDLGMLLGQWLTFQGI